MSLAKLKKAELVALAEANDLGVDPDWNKDEIIEELEAAGITTENDNEVSTDADEGHAHVSKAERQAKLKQREHG